MNLCLMTWGRFFSVGTKRWNLPLCGTNGQYLKINSFCSYKNNTNVPKQHHRIFYRSANQAVLVCRKCFLKSFSTSTISQKDGEQNGISNIREKASSHTDPELKAIVKEINADFQKVLGDQASQSKTSVSSIASSDSDSDSSDSDSDSSDSESDSSDSDTSSSSVGKSDDNSNSLASIKNETVEKVTDKFDIDQELLRYDYEEYEKEFISDEEEEEVEEIPVISLNRGQTGVYDIDELVQLLNEENAEDLCVISVPKELKYVDYMVIVTGRSVRHLRAMAEYVKKLYKKKRSKRDKPTCIIEGSHSSEWLAIDLGNIALHIFTEPVREYYDLETLWTVGPEYDEKTQQDEADVVPFFWEQKNTDYIEENPTEKANSKVPSDHQLTLDSMDQWHQKPS